ncbi:MAG: hypothetical protein KJ847_06265, partial [Firmicutes bacterium]|nr:hypothetical protein [Bacillota bacterium]
ERNERNFKKKPWDTKNLPELPKKDVLKVSKTGSLIGLIFTLIFGVIFGYVLYFNQDYLRVVYTDGSTHLSEPLFLNDAIMTYFPIFIISILLNVGVLLAKIYQGYLGLNVMILQTIQKAFSLFAFLFFIQMNPLFNLDFISQVGTVLELSNATILENIQNFFRVITVIACIGVGIDIITTWIKYLRHQKELSKVS